MYVDLGKVKPGTTLFVPFHTFDSNDPSASVTITGLATTDIEVYKDASMTQRASDSGYALVDSDGVDLDGTTGIHGVTIDLSDNTTAGFWAAGSDYIVVIASITVDAATVNFISARFRIGYDGAFHETSIATLASQTSFTLTAGSADDNAYNGCKVIVHDVASAIQMCIGYVLDYTGATKTVTLAADPGIFTMAASDNISFYPPDNVMAVNGTAQTANDNGADINNILLDTGELQTDDVPGLIAALNNLSAADVNAQVDQAIEDYHLDHLLAVTYDPASKPGAADALLNEIIESDAGVSRFTQNSLERIEDLTLSATISEEAIEDIAEAIDQAAFGTVVEDKLITYLPIFTGG